MVGNEASSSGWGDSCIVSGHISVSHLHPGVKARAVSQKEELRAQIPETATPQGSGCSVGDCSKRKRRHCGQQGTVSQSSVVKGAPGVVWCSCFKPSAVEWACVTFLFSMPNILAP